MKTIIRTKLLDDKHVEAREYELFKSDVKIILCSNKNYKSCYHIGEPFQVYTIKTQKEGKVINSQTSMFYPFKTYRMYKLRWSPKEEIKTKVVSDKEIIFTGDTAKLP